MCGIVGILDLKGKRPVDRSLLEQMNQTQFHRGPDEGGTHIEPGLGLGHRRLSIIDLSSGQQPLFNEDHTVVVTYNGEIYNFPELSDELKAKGHVFRTHCDTEVIVHAWEEWGESCVERFRGMFAFAVWDRNQQTLFLARDRLGIKPLYYAELDDGYFVFGSELKSLMAHPALSRELNPEAVEDYFALGYIPDPKTIFRKVFKLPPGHTLLLRNGRPVSEPREYWDVSFKPSTLVSEAEIQEELIVRLREAVKIRMVAEVPLGAFLSGGVDSSAVVAMMAELQDQPVNSCAIGFDVPDYNETEFAQLVADRYKTEHFVQTVDSDDYDLIEHLAALYDEPYADSSAIPTYRVCQLAKNRVTVALSGDGGDENFAGYRRYRWHMKEQGIRDALPFWLRKSVFGIAGEIYPKMDWAPKYLRAKSTLQSLARSTVSAYQHTVSISTDDQRNRMFSASFKRSLGGYRVIDTLNRHIDRSPTDHPLSMIQYLDMKTYLPGDILTKVDRASMAHALEVRVPLLDHEFTDWVSGLPAEHKLHKSGGKYIFKKSLESRLPHDVLYRDKMGFGVPLAKWFRGPLRERIKQTISHGILSDTGLFNQDYLNRLVSQHLSGQREHSAVLWSLLMFDASLKHLKIRF